MAQLVILLFFVGMFMIVAGVYEQRFQTMKKLVRTEYKFIPRTLYDESYSQVDVNALYKNYFDSPDPWASKTSGDRPSRFPMPSPST